MCTRLCTMRIYHNKRAVLRHRATEKSVYPTEILLALYRKTALVQQEWLTVARNVASRCSIILSVQSPVKPFWYYCSRIALIARIFLLVQRAFAPRRWRILRILWALHAHFAISSLLRPGTLLHNLCYRISPRVRYGPIAKWACNAHKIRQIRHLRGAKARCMSDRIRAIGAIREHNVRMVSPYSNNSDYCTHWWN